MPPDQHLAPQHGRDVVRVIKTLAELLIHQAVVIERLTHQEELRDKFITDLLRGRLTSKTGSPPPEAAIFDIDLAPPRVAVAIAVGGVLERLAGSSARGDTLPVIARARRRERARADLLHRALQNPGSSGTGVYGFVDGLWLVLLATVDPLTVETDRSRIAQRMQRFVDGLAGSFGTPTSAGTRFRSSSTPARLTRRS